MGPEGRQGGGGRDNAMGRGGGGGGGGGMLRSVTMEIERGKDNAPHYGS